MTLFGFELGLSFIFYTNFSFHCKLPFLLTKVDFFNLNDFFAGAFKYFAAVIQLSEHEPYISRLTA